MANLKCGIPFAELDSRASNRTAWHTTCQDAIEKLELNRTDQLKEKRQRRKRQPTATADGFICDICYWFKNRLVRTQKSSLLMRFVVSTNQSMMMMIIRVDF